METQALTTRPDEQAMPAVQDPQPAGITPAQAKVDAIAALTLSAYQKASQLNMTDEEIAAMMADFPDEAFKGGAAGKENLIYIEHAYLRDRLNSVFRPGQWAIVPRNRWAENFRTQKGQEAVRVYVEAMLCIRGCFAAESVGEMEYYPNNAIQNYGDAVEGAKTAALRRCCKELGMGLQAYKKDWCEGWWARKRGHQPARQPEPTRPTQTSTPKPTVVDAEPVAPKSATDKTRSWMIQQLKADKENRETVERFFGVVGAMMPGETIEELPLRFVPRTKEEVKALVTAIADFDRGEVAHLPYPVGELESAPKKEPADKRPRVRGVISKVSIKNGVKKDGTPWTSYGIKIDDSWYNTFSSTIGEKAKELEGKEATIICETTERGNNAVEIE